MKVGSGELDAAGRSVLQEIWDDATNSVCQTMQERKMCNCPNGDCLAAKVNPGPADFTRFATLAAPVDHPEVVGDETGWLIELRGNVPMWWTLDPKDEPCWTKDSLKALRFARKVDADAYIYDIGWTEAFASEHAWMETRP